MRLSHLSPDQRGTPNHHRGLCRPHPYKSDQIVDAAFNRGIAPVHQPVDGMPLGASDQRKSNNDRGRDAEKG